jgi:type II secretory pathway pseudopilin PulG
MMKKGFSIIEILVVISTIALASVYLMRSFSLHRTYIQEATNTVLADLVTIQTNALAAKNYNDVARCGYGIHFINSITYSIYVAPQPAVDNGYCSTLDRKYNDSGPVYIKDIVVSEEYITGFGPVEFDASFSDIFFEPPDPKVYVNGTYDVAGAPGKITIREIGQSCVSGKCRSICVYPSSKIEHKNGISC